MSKKKMVGTAAAVIMALSLGTGVFSAFANDNSQKQETANQADRQSIAAAYGIDASGMTDEQFKAAVVAYEAEHPVAKDAGSATPVSSISAQEELAALTAKYVIDTTGMSDDQMKRAVGDYEKSHPQAKDAAGNRSK